MSQVEENFNPGGYLIQRADLYFHNEDPRAASEARKSLVGSITEIEFGQTLDSASYSGSIYVRDSRGLLENFPLRGQEKLHLTIRTLDTKTTVNLYLFIHSITNLGIDNTTKGVGYRLNVISYTSWEASKRKIIEAYKRPGNTVVRQLFTKYFNKLGAPEYTDNDGDTMPYGVVRHKLTNTEAGTKYFYIQPTVGLLETIIPNMAAHQAINFIVKQSYSGDNSPSQSFRFFETWDGFYYVTDEFLTQQGKNKPFSLFFSPGTGTNDATKNPANQLNRIEDLQIVNSGRTSSAAMGSGAYKSKVIEIDLVRGVVNEHKFDYLEKAQYVDMNGEATQTSNLPQTVEFIQDTYTEENSVDMFIFKNYTGTGDLSGTLRGDAHFPEIVQNRIAYNYHLNTIVLNAKLKGRADIKPGAVIDLDLPNLDGAQEVRKNPQLSGRYLVTKTVHTFKEGMLYNNMSLSKFNWSK